MSLYLKTVKGIKWSFIATFGTMPVQFVITIVLARLLLPEDFGLIGMSLVAVSISKTMIESGLNQALIQKKDATAEDCSVIFTYNLFVSLIFFAFILLSANAIERFYNQNGISNIVKALSVIVIIEAFSIIQRADLAKTIRFDVIAKANIFSVLLSGAIAIWLAFVGAGIWALVWKQVIQSLAVTVFYWLLNPIKLKVAFSWKRFKPLFGFGAKISFADQIENLSNQLARILIGKNYTPNDLGFYIKAEQFHNLISQSAIIGANKVVFPSFAQIQSEDVKLKHSYKNLIKIAMLFTFPLMFTAIGIADHVIPFLIGDKWLEIVPYFKILCIGGMIYPFTVFNLNIIKVKGRANLYVKVSVISKGLMVPAVLIGLQFHITGLLVALVIQKLCAGIINGFYSGKLINYGISEQIKDILPFLFIAGGLFATISSLDDFISMYLDSDLFITAIVTLFMMAGYLALLKTFQKEEFRRIKNILFDSVR